MDNFGHFLLLIVPHPLHSPLHGAGQRGCPLSLPPSLPATLDPRTDFGGCNDLDTWDFETSDPHPSLDSRNDFGHCNDLNTCCF